MRRNPSGWCEAFESETGNLADRVRFTKKEFAMSIATLRPTFEIEIPLSFDALNRGIQQELACDPWKATSLAFDGYSELHIPKEQVRYWSPHLSLQLEPTPQGTLVTGRFAPRQEVWTLVWVVYLLLTFVAFFSLIYSYAVWLMKQQTWMLLVPPTAVLGIFALHVVSRIGQQWSTDQMHTLRDDFDRLMQRVIERATQE